MNDEERYLVQRITELREHYEREAKPWVDRLVRLRSLRPVPPFMVTVERARELEAAGVLRPTPCTPTAAPDAPTSPDPAAPSA